MFFLVTQPLMGVLGPHTLCTWLLRQHARGGCLWGGWRLRDGSGFADFQLSSQQHTQAVNPRPRRAGCLPGWSGAWWREGHGHGSTPCRASIIAKIFAEKSAAPPRGKPGPGAEPHPGLQPGEQGMNASGSREPSTARHLQPARPGSAEGTGQGRGAGHGPGL